MAPSAVVVAPALRELPSNSQKALFDLSPSFQHFSLCLIHTLTAFLHHLFPICILKSHPPPLEINMGLPSLSFFFYPTKFVVSSLSLCFLFVIQQLHDTAVNQSPSAHHQLSHEDVTPKEDGKPKTKHVLGNEAKDSYHDVPSIDYDASEFRDRRAITKRANDLQHSMIRSHMTDCTCRLCGEGCPAPITARKSNKRNQISFPCHSMSTSSDQKLQSQLPSAYQNIDKPSPYYDTSPLNPRSEMDTPPHPAFLNTSKARLNSREDGNARAMHRSHSSPRPVPYRRTSPSRTFRDNFSLTPEWPRGGRQRLRAMSAPRSDVASASSVGSGEDGISVE